MNFFKKLKEAWGPGIWGWLGLVVAPAVIFVIGGLLVGLGNVLVFSLAFLGSLFVALIQLLKFSSLKSEARFYSQYFKNVISNLNDGVIFYDSDFKITIFNETAERLFNLKSDEVLGQRVGPERLTEKKYSFLTQVIFPSLAPSVVERSVLGVFPQVVDLSFEEPKLELRVTTNKLTDEAGRTVGFIKIVRDRTEEISLARDETDFVTVAAHQLRTPLTAVKWTFENLSSDDSLSQDGKALTKTGLEATQKLMKTVDDLLSVAKIEAGRFGYDFEDKEITGFIKEVMKGEESVARYYGVKLDFESSLAQTTVRIDAQKLSLALENLIVNAIKYNTKNGSVTVKLEPYKDAPYVLISVSDTGIGIPPEDMAKIFTKFFRAKNAVSLETEGTGMGLYITKAIILRHGGQIWAESTLGRGTTFCLVLPTDFSLIPQTEAPTFL